ncbi:hypothetical protein ALC152_15680 [Arcobacter sp. 15-2]|uniref:hypothetical protein n=1 Tax=Arcobacter sp. 15-2 TaxID=3374109 RepID=UPI00399D4186
MNKKILMSIAAAATMATVFTGCGSDSSSSDKAAGATTNGAGVATIGGVTVGSSKSVLVGAKVTKSGNTITTTGGTMVGVDANDDNVSDTMKGSIQTDVSITDANGMVINNIFTDAAVKSGDSDVNATLAAIETKTGLNLRKVLQVSDTKAESLALVMYDNIQEGGADAEQFATILKLSGNDLNATLSAMNDKRKTPINADVVTKMAEMITSGVSVTALAESLNDYNELNASEKADYNASAFETKITEIATAEQAQYKADGVTYLDANTSDTDITLNDANTSNLVTDAKKATLSLMYKNQGNANLSYAVSLKGIDLNSTSGTYSYNIANNTNVTWWATDTDGMGTAGTLSAIDADTNQTVNDANMSLEGIISNGVVATSYPLMWLQAAANFDINESNLTGYNVNVDGNWTVTGVLSAEDNTSKALTLYTVTDGNYTQADAGSINIGTVEKAGAKVIDTESLTTHH